MLVKQMLPRVRERLAVIEAEAPVREAAYLMLRTLSGISYSL